MKTALVIIDTQVGAFTGDWPMPDGDELITVCQRLVAHARARGWPVLWVQHHEPGGPMDGAGFAIDPRLAPAADEPRILKVEPDAFSNAALAPLLAGQERILLAGLQSDCCVQATALGGDRRAVPVTVVADAHHTWPQNELAATAVRDRVNQELQEAGIPLTTMTEVLA
ncbi:cysteine hydrolase family protein [Roseateles sp. BYS96W]|uniref:Cysteine hydrolase family protein n=1 Tax=Pelomonas nitida TaxID=3299027 RepID=A0ABW7GAJ0_9BURK